VNWAGFYVLDPKAEEQLILGPFNGKVACQTISFKRGVCGAAARTGETQLGFYPFPNPSIEYVLHPFTGQNVKTRIKIKYLECKLTVS